MNYKKLICITIIQNHSEQVMARRRLRLIIVNIKHGNVKYAFLLSNLAVPNVQREKN